VIQEAAPALDRMAAAFADATGRSAAGVHEGAYAFAGRPVRLRVAGEALGRRTHRAFAHLRAQETAAAPELVVELWDEAETAIPCPVDADATDLDRRWIAAGGILAASASGRYVSFRYQDSVAVLDRSAGRIVGCRGAGSRLSTGEYSKPLVHLLSIWFHDRGVQLLHAGLIAGPRGGVLIPGEGGTGKSTSCVAAATQGLEFLGDDFIGLEQVDGNFVGHSVFGTACLARRDLDRFRAIAGLAVDDGIPEEEKPILFLPEVFPERLRASVPVRAVVLLRVGADRTEVRPAGRAETMRHFAASTLHTVMPRPGREALVRLAALVERVPAWWLLLGPDIEDLAPGVDRILSAAVSRHES
jgi:hypothetical protein